MQKILTAYNEQINKWAKEPDINTVLQAKETRMKLFEEKFNGNNFEKSFTKTRKYVLEKIIYHSVETGIYCATGTIIAKKCEVSVKTIERTVKELKATGQFVIAYSANEHKGGYIFIDRLHKNFENIMLDLFPAQAAEYIEPGMGIESASENH